MERDLLSGVFNVTRVISTHTLTWSVTGLTDDDISDEFDFNSHAHVERDKVVRAQDYLGEISTHTLTWSVTRLSIPHNTGDETISTHTLTWSVTF